MRWLSSCRADGRLQSGTQWDSAAQLLRRQALPDEDWMHRDCSCTVLMPGPCCRVATSSKMGSRLLRVLSPSSLIARPDLLRTPHSRAHLTRDDLGIEVAVKPRHQLDSDLAALASIPTEVDITGRAPASTSRFGPSWRLTVWRTGCHRARAAAKRDFVGTRMGERAASGWYADMHASCWLAWSWQISKRCVPVELSDDQERRVARERIQQPCKTPGGERMQPLLVRRHAPVAAHIRPSHTKSRGTVALVSEHIAMRFARIERRACQHRRSAPASRRALLEACGAPVSDCRWSWPALSTLRPGLRLRWTHRAPSCMGEAGLRKDQCSLPCTYHDGLDSSVVRCA